MDVDRLLMEYKLALRAVSKPGDNLCEVCSELHNDHIELSGSDVARRIYLFEVIIGTYQYYPITMEFEAFDDFGEWEFRPTTGRIEHEG